MSNRIVLGTAQFGMHYGVANRQGRVELPEVARIITSASRNNIDTVDTARVYGNAEQLLGSVGIDNFKVVTKIPSIPEVEKDYGRWIYESVESTLKDLRQDHLYGVLLHDAEQIFSERGNLIVDTLLSLKKDKKCEKVGISIYDTEACRRCLAVFKPDIVQAPFNVVDRRIKDEGLINDLYEQKIELHARSVFLQGLLLLGKELLPSAFKSNTVLNEWRDWLDIHTVSALDACLGFVLRHKKVRKVVVGIDSLHQFEQIMNSARHPYTGVIPELSDFRDSNLLDPRKWEDP